MTDTVALANMVKALQPDRLLLFDEVPTLLQYKRSGGGAAIPDNVLREVPERRVEEVTAEIENLLQLLGYE